MAAFIFDMDGCLVDSIGAWHEAEQQVMNVAGIELTKEQRDELNALTLEEAGKFFHERFGILGSADEVVQAVLDYLLVFYRERAQANPGAVEFVRAVHETGAPMCVLSSSPQAFLQAGLAHAGLREFFADDRIISAEDEGLPKRNGETFARVCEILGTEPGETWLFDDSWYALARAHEAGLRTVGTHSDDKCGSHEELSRYCDLVVEDFTGLDVAAFA